MRSVLLEELGVLVFELGDYVLVEEEGGDCCRGVVEVFVEAGLLEDLEVPDHRFF